MDEDNNLNHIFILSQFNKLKVFNNSYKSIFFSLQKLSFNLLLCL